MESVLKPSKPRYGLYMRFDRKRKWQRQSSRFSPTLYELLGEKFANHVSNDADFNITGIKEKQNIIL